MQSPDLVSNGGSKTKFILIKIGKKAKVGSKGQTNISRTKPITQIIAQDIVAKVIIETHMRCMSFGLSKPDLFPLPFNTKFKIRVFASFQSKIRSGFYDVDLSLFPSDFENTKVIRL